jgi:hypothetical protein
MDRDYEDVIRALDEADPTPRFMLHIGRLYPIKKTLAEFAKVGDNYPSASVVSGWLNAEMKECIDRLVARRWIIIDGKTKLTNLDIIKGKLLPLMPAKYDDLRRFAAGVDNYWHDEHSFQSTFKITPAMTETSIAMAGNLNSRYNWICSLLQGSIRRSLTKDHDIYLLKDVLAAATGKTEKAVINILDDIVKESTTRQPDLEGENRLFL